jgi:hypothetical protein
MCHPVPASFSNLLEREVKQNEQTRTIKMRSAADGSTQEAHAVAGFVARFWLKELMEPSAIA